MGLKNIKQSNIQLSPNPVRDFLNIKNSGNRIGKIEVYNVQGKLLKSCLKNLKQIDMRSFGSGVYFVKVYGDSGDTVQKIVKR